MLVTAGPVVAKTGSARTADASAAGGRWDFTEGEG